MNDDDCRLSETATKLRDAPVAKLKDVKPAALEYLANERGIVARKNPNAGHKWWDQLRQLIGHLDRQLPRAWCEDESDGVHPSLNAHLNITAIHHAAYLHSDHACTSRSSRTARLRSLARISAS